MEKTYAQVLWRLVESGMTPHEAVKKLRDMLMGLGRESLLPRIAREFSRLAEAGSKRSELVLTVAREKDARHAHTEALAVLKGMGVEATDLKTQVDDTIVGGWRLEGRERLVDASYKKQLLELFERATQ
jgi:F0F1-type ATP synthase delta subunit